MANGLTQQQLEKDAEKFNDLYGPERIESVAVGQGWSTAFKKDVHGYRDKIERDTGEEWELVEQKDDDNVLFQNLDTGETIEVDAITGEFSPIRAAGDTGGPAGGSEGGAGGGSSPGPGTVINTSGATNNLEAQLGSKFRVMGINLSDPDDEDSLESNILLQYEDGRTVRLYSGDAVPGFEDLIVGEIAWFRKPNHEELEWWNQTDLGVEFSTPGADGLDTIMVADEEPKFLSGGTVSWAKPEPVPEPEPSNEDPPILEDGFPFGLGISETLLQGVKAALELQIQRRGEDFKQQLDDSGMNSEERGAALTGFDQLQNEDWDNLPYDKPNMQDVMVESYGGSGENLAIDFTDYSSGATYQYHPNRPPDDQWDYISAEEMEEMNVALEDAVDTGDVTYDPRFGEL
jgi:hypothetical protein